MKNNKICAVRKIHFCYGHRVMGHENKCASLHGHNGVIWVHARAKNQLDTVGRVIDFSVLKDIVGGWVDEHWDHTMIICSRDEHTLKALALAPSKKPVFILPENPTAENMADYLLNHVCPVLLKDSDVIVEKIVLWETENCFVEAIL